MIRPLLAVGVLLALACAGGSPEPTPDRPQQPAPPPEPTLDDPRLEVVDPPEPLLKPEPLRPEAHAALCDSPFSCELLVHYTVEQLEAGDACALCGASRCGERWPFAEVPSCEMWHELERCIWQATGARKLPDLDVPARQNVIELQRRLDEQIACRPD